MELGAVIIILIIAIIIFLSFYMISIYNKIFLTQKRVLKKFEPVDLSIKKYITITNELKDISEDNNLTEELSILSMKLSRVRNNNKKILVLKDADYTINKAFDMYNKNKKIKILKGEYEKYNNKILYAKDIYNKKVKEYNKLIYEFPYFIITRLFKIKKLNIIDGE